MDRFQKWFYNQFVTQVERTVEYAILNATPAKLYSLSFPTSGLQNNRRGDHRPLNNNANLLIAQATSGEWLGGLVNFAIHGTHYNEDNLLFSADVPGGIERALEQSFKNMNGIVRLINNPKFLFINGAEGDVSPRLSIEESGNEFAKQTLENMSNIEEIIPEWTSVQKRVKLPKAHVDVSKCAEQKWLPKRINIGIHAFIKNETVIGQVRFGDLWLMSWPGEATTELGNLLIQQAESQGAKNAWVMGLTNDHLAYFVTPEEFAVGGYETCANFFGEEGGEKIIEHHKSF
jgi:hypothetical protein